MSVQRKLAGITLAAALVFAGAGCGDDAAEKITEKALEKSSGGKVDVDSKDGTVKLTDKDGNTSSYGTGTELPKGWPDELKPPKSITILASSTSTTNGKKQLFVTAESSATVTELSEGLKAQFEDAGYEITNESNLSSTDGGYASIEAKGPKYTASVSLAGDSSSKGKTTVLFNVTPNA